jgi:hypothetical protein
MLLHAYWGHYFIIEDALLEILVRDGRCNQAEAFWTRRARIKPSTRTMRLKPKIRLAAVLSAWGSGRLPLRKNYKEC